MGRGNWMLTPVYCVSEICKLKFEVQIQVCLSIKNCSILHCSYWTGITWRPRFEEESTFASGKIYEWSWIWNLTTRLCCSSSYCVADAIGQGRNASSHCNRGLYRLLFIYASRKELWDYIPWTTERSSTKLVCLFRRSRGQQSVQRKIGKISNVSLLFLKI